MKKIIFMVLSLAAINSFAISMLMDFESAWSSNKAYRVQIIHGINAKSAPVVYDNAGTFVLNGSSVPTTGVHPESSSAWTSI